MALFIRPSIRTTFLCACVLAGVFCARRALAADYYVDPVAGSDTSGDGSAAKPWATLTKAMSGNSTVGPGDTVYVAPGTFAAKQTLIKAGSNGHDILVAPLDTSSAKPILSQGVEIWGDCVDFDGFEVTTANTSTQNQICVMAYGNYDQIRNNNVHACYSCGIKFSCKGSNGTCQAGSGVGAIISGNVVHDTNHGQRNDTGAWCAAISTGTNAPVFPNASNVQITDNVVCDSAGEGISPWLGDHVLIQGNKVYGVEQSGIYVNEATNSIVNANLVTCAPTTNDCPANSYCGGIGVQQGGRARSPRAATSTS